MANPRRPGSDPRPTQPGRLATRTFAAALLASGLLAGCSWRASELAGALPEPFVDVPAPALGTGVPEILAVVHASEPGGMDVELRELRISRVTDGFWEEVDADDAARAPHGELAIIAVRRCGDWTGRDHWKAERASWYVLRDGGLAAYDHWTFGPRCTLGNAFAPSPAALLETEQTLRSFVDQRYPPHPPPLAIRFRRGLAYLAADRLAEARAELQAGDQGLAVRQDLYEARDPSPLYEEAFRLESAQLYSLREELAAALAKRTREGR